MNINEYKRQERNLKKNYFDYDWLKKYFLLLFLKYH
jgi:hypothetical protein